MELHVVIFLFLFVHLLDPLGTHFAIYLHCQHHFQCIKTDTYPHIQFFGYNCIDKLIEMLFVLWVNSCKLLEMWFVTHMMKCIIHCLVSVNIQQVSMRKVVSTWNNSMKHLCFVYTFFSSVILPECNSADICN